MLEHFDLQAYLDQTSHEWEYLPLNTAYVTQAIPVARGCILIVGDRGNTVYEWIYVPPRPRRPAHSDCGYSTIIDAVADAIRHVQASTRQP